MHQWFEVKVWMELFFFSGHGTGFFYEGATPPAALFARKYAPTPYAGGLHLAPRNAPPDTTYKEIRLIFYFFYVKYSPGVTFKRRKEDEKQFYRLNLFGMFFRLY